MLLEGFRPQRPLAAFVAGLLLACSTPGHQSVAEREEPEPGDSPSVSRTDAAVAPDSPRGSPPIVTGRDAGSRPGPEDDLCPSLGLPTVCGVLAARDPECTAVLEDDSTCMAMDARCELRECYLHCVDRPCFDLPLVGDDGIITAEDCARRCESEFYCDGGFVRFGQLCDGVPDCPGDEDELTEQCLRPDPDFECGTERLSRDQVCDGIQNCTRGDDEPCPGSFECAPCTCGMVGRAGCSAYVDCSPGDRVEVTLDADQLLDGVADCPLGEDEHLPDQITCRTKDRDQWCEELRSATTGYLCEGTDMRIPRRDVCNGTLDCPAGDDESCTNRTEMCPEQHEIVGAFLDSLGTRDLMGALIAVDGDHLCNLIDTPENCPFLLCNDAGCFFPCANGQLLFPTQVADGVLNCPGGEDEPCAPAFTCSDQTLLPFDKTCDGVSDCSDGSDEEGCPKRLQPFICGDGKQIVFPGPKCEYRCVDGSDAMRCGVSF